MSHTAGTAFSGTVLKLKFRLWRPGKTTRNGG